MTVCHSEEDSLSDIKDLPVSSTKSLNKKNKAEGTAYQKIQQQEATVVKGYNQLNKSRRLLDHLYLPLREAILHLHTSYTKVSKLEQIIIKSWYAFGGYWAELFLLFVECA